MRNIDEQYERYTDRLHDDINSPKTIKCDQCGKNFHDDELWGSYLDKNKNFCSKKCIGDLTEGIQARKEEEDV